VVLAISQHYSVRIAVDRKSERLIKNLLAIVSSSVFDCIA